MPRVTLWNDYKEHNEIINIELGKLSSQDIANNKSTWDKAGTSVQISQDYNGVKISSNSGIEVVSSKNKLLLNASKGIELSKKDNGETIFSVDTNGDLVLKGNMYMTGGSIMWDKVTAPDYSYIKNGPPKDATNTWSDLTTDDRIKGIFFTKDGKLAIKADAIRIDNTTVFESGYNPKEIKDKVDNMQIGGRNILLNSGDFLTKKYWELNSGTSVDVVEQDGERLLKGVGSYKQWSHVLYKLKPNTEYIFSAEVMFDRAISINESAPLHCWTKNGDTVHSAAKSLISPNRTTTPNAWEKIVIRIKTAPVGDTEFTPFIFHQDLNTYNVVSYLRNMQLEEGNTLTAWQPNPSDMYSRMDDIQVGGRNLIENTGFRTAEGWANTGSKSYDIMTEALSPSGKRMDVDIGDGTKSVGVHHPPINDLVSGQTYTWSVYLRASRNCSITVGSERGGTKVCAATTAWQKFTHTFVANTNTQYRSFILYFQADNSPAKFYFHSVKLESGNKPTDWTPAPEDDAKLLLEKESSLRDYTNNKVDNIKIGGRNLLIASTNYDYKAWSLQATKMLNERYKGTYIVEAETDWASLDYRIKDLYDRGLVKIGEEVTYSCSARMVGGTTSKDLRFYLEGSSKSGTIPGKVDNNWKRFSVTFPYEQAVVDNNGNARFEVYEISNTPLKLQVAEMKLELGNKATDWTPAIEDVNVGGRNYVLGSDSSITKANVTNAAQHANGYDISTEFDVVGTIGKEICISMDYQTKDLKFGTTSPWIGYQISCRNSTGTSFAWLDCAGNKELPEGTSKGFQRWSNVHVLPAGTASIVVTRVMRDFTGEATLKNVKLEVGNKPTDWTPAPEDINNKVDNIKVGSRNLLKNSAFLDGTYIGWDKWGMPPKLWVDTQSTIKDSPRCISMEVNASNQGILQNVKVTAGQEYTLSAWVWTKAGATIKPALMANNGGAYTTVMATKENTWERISITYTAKSNNETIYIGRSGAIGTGTYSFVSIQLEEGNRVTDWSPAPEDFTTALENYKTTVNQQFVASDGAFTSKINETKELISSGRIFLRGTGQNRPSNRIIRINDKDVIVGGARGHYVVVLRRSDLSIIFSQAYDTHGGLQCDIMADKLNGYVDDVIILITTHDSAYVNTKLSEALMRIGGSGKLINEQRVPQAYIGIPGIGRGNGIEAITTGDANAPFAEISTVITNGIPQGINSPLSIVASQLGTAIEQTSGRIGLVVKQSGGKDVIDGAALVSAINLTPDAVQIDAKNIKFQGDVSFDSYVASKAKAEIANTQYGGTNLLQNSNFFRGKETWYNSGVTDGVMGTDPQYGNFITMNSSGATANVWKGMSQNLKDYASIQEFTKGDTVSVSFWYKVNTALDAGMGIEIKGVVDGGTQNNAFPFPYIPKETPVGKWMKYTGTASCTYNSCKNPYFYIWITKNGSISISQVKLERGGVCTEWSPSPLDTQYSIDNITIGGRNLIRNSANPINLKNWGSNVVLDKSDYLKENVFTITNTATTEKTTSSTRVRVNPNTQYTLSALVWVDGNATLDMYFLGRNFDVAKEYEYVHEYSPRNIPAKTWTMITYTFTTGANEREGYVRFDNNGFSGTSAVSFTRVKLEAGNRATDWSPAPEDAEEAIVDVATSLNNRGAAWDGARDLVNAWKGAAINGTTSIRGGVIETNTITADKIAIADFTNYAQNPQFAEGTNVGWTSNVTVVQNTLGGPTKFLGRVQQRDSYGEYYFTVRPGDVFYVSADVYTTDSQLSIGIGLQYSDADQKNFNWPCTYQAPTGGKWVRVEGEVKSTDARFVKARPFIQINGSSNFGNWYFTNVDIRRKNAGNLIVDGAINARHIQANAINATHISAGTITAAEINMANLTANTAFINAVKATSISADKISGGTISGVNINVTTDLYVGNKIQIGSHTSAVYKEISFNGVSRISNQGSNGEIVKISAMSTNINDGHVYLGNSNYRVGIKGELDLSEVQRIIGGVPAVFA